jgi:hypothetical protein
MKPRSLVKAGTRESTVGTDDPGTPIAAAELEDLLSRLTFEDLVATRAFGLTLSGCLPLRAAK